MKRKQKEAIIGLLLGEVTTHKKAKLIADTYAQCPYCVSYISAGCTVIGVFSIPQDHQWWLEWVAKNPEETLGLRCAEVFFTKKVEASSPWSRGEAKASIEKAPCGADCEECFRYQKECGGCPATRHYDDG